MSADTLAKTYALTLVATFVCGGWLVERRLNKQSTRLPLVLPLIWGAAFGVTALLRRG